MTFRFPPTEDARQRVMRLMQRELGRHLLIPSIVLTEYMKIAGGRVGSEAALTHLNEIESRGATVIDLNKQIALEAGKLLNRDPDFPIADALLAASAVLHSAEYIITSDEHFE